MSLCPQNCRFHDTVATGFQSCGTLRLRNGEPFGLRITRLERMALRLCALAGFIVACSLSICAQAPEDGANSLHSVASEQALPESPSPLLLKSLPRDIFQDQKDFWFTPFRLTKHQWEQTIPFTFVAAGLLASDTGLQRNTPRSSDTISRANLAANGGLGLLVGAGAGMYLFGEATHNDHQSESGLLSGEAAIDAALEATILQRAFGRERPLEGDGRGRFFQGGTSFPSLHATTSWAIASVLANEYPGPATRILAYGVATGVSLSRGVGQKHFATDVLVGSALGWYTGRQVFRAHSRYSPAEIARYGSFSKQESGVETLRDPKTMGSPYVPVDSWVYPAFDRLIALGFISDRTISIRPWSRLECARLLSRIHERLALDPDAFDEGPELLRDLDREFAPEVQLQKGETPNVNAELESVYSRYTDIQGSPLLDSFHFAQTVVDDFGRPYGRGSNALSGITAHAEAGPFVFYVRGEYQYGSSSPDYTQAQAQYIADFDQLPLNSVPTFNHTSHFRTVEAYAGLNIGDWQFTFGQQSLWWGTARSTSLLISNNAEAMPMMRIDRTSPMRLPSLFGLLGPLNVSVFLARMGGTRYLRLGPGFELYGDGIHSVDPQPFIWGANLAFKPTSNLELSFSITTLFAGHGRPLTLNTFLHTFSQHGNLQAFDPGGRRPMMSTSYRLPRMRSVQVYADWLAEAQPIAIAYPTQSALSAGIYVSHFPHMRNLDLRCEGSYTNAPGNSINNLFYVNFHYPNGYRNYGQIIGSWIGRGGNGGEASTTYWFSSRNRLTFSYRRMIATPSLLGGGNLHDFSGSIGWMLRPQIEVASMLQYERWNFPALHNGPDSNLAASIEFRFWPKLSVRGSR